MRWDKSTHMSALARVMYRGYPLRVRSRMYVRKLARTQQSHPPIPLLNFNKNDRMIIR